MERSEAMFERVHLMKIAMILSQKSIWALSALHRVFVFEKFGRHIQQSEQFDFKMFMLEATCSDLHWSVCFF